MVLIKLTSDNYEDQLLTVDAYEEATLQMSTGDFCTHKATVFVTGKYFEDTYLTLEDVA